MADLGVEFTLGEPGPVAFGERAALLVLVIAQGVEDMAGIGQRAGGIAVLAQRAVQGVGHPGAPVRQFGAHRDIAPAARAARARRAGLEIG